jgi:hypothetical protein
MALFTDGAPSTIDDMAAQDSQLLNVAYAEGIDVAQKLMLAQNELSFELITLLTGNSYRDQWLWATSKPHLNSVVVTPALKLWNTYRALELVYSDAYNNQLNDRYGGKRDQFHLMAKQWYEKLREAGNRYGAASTGCAAGSRDGAAFLRRQPAGRDVLRGHSLGRQGRRRWPGVGTGGGDDGKQHVPGASGHGTENGGGVERLYGNGSE